jgi:hypothetical protein
MSGNVKRIQDWNIEKKEVTVIARRHGPSNAQTREN